MSGFDRALFTASAQRVITHSGDRPGAAALLSGRVLRVGSDGVAVDVHGDLVACRRAASCLLEPTPGDAVLVAASDADSYVLAVLERSSTIAATLSVNAPSEATVLRGGEISLVAGRSLQLEAPSATVRTRRFTVLADVMGFVGQLMTQAFERWRTAATRVDVVATDISTKAARRTSLIEETDVLQAGAQVQTLTMSSVTSAPAIVVAAKEDLRLDGERVTVG